MNQFRIEAQKSSGGKFLYSLGNCVVCIRANAGVSHQNLHILCEQYAIHAGEMFIFRTDNNAAYINSVQSATTYIGDILSDIDRPQSRSTQRSSTNGNNVIRQFKLESILGHSTLSKCIISYMGKTLGQNNLS